jgi:PadR family transcriptional regulator, regulatory protein PadR
MNQNPPDQNRVDPKRIDLDLVLLATLETGALYGLEIIKEVNSRTDGALEFKEGSLYPALHRLVKSGWVETTWQPSTSGGPPRKYYQLTEGGTKACQQKKLEWKQTRNALDALMTRFLKVGAC